jgi:hypothetical protein
MSSVNEQEIEDGVFEDVEPPCVALAAPAQELTWTRKGALHRPDPSFVTQLIATAEHVPQTRALRRGTSADAKAAYGASWREAPVQRAGIRTRQIV